MINKKGNLIVENRFISVCCCGRRFAAVVSCGYFGFKRAWCIGIWFV